jgi:hypothetical protein
MDEPTYIKYIEPSDLKDIVWIFDIPELRPIRKPKMCNCIKKYNIPQISHNITHFIYRLFSCCPLK